MTGVQDVLFSTKNVTEEYLASRFPEVAAPEFYRELFPSGSLEKRGEHVEGKYCAIAVRVGEDRAYRYSITDDLETVNDLIQTDDFCIMSPVTYAGKTQKQSMARWLYSITLDLDKPISELNKWGEPTGISEFFFEQGNGLIPLPTYIVSSGTGLHLYYMLERPVPLYPNVIKQLSNLRHDLIWLVWNRYITELGGSPQYESVTQGFRMVGSTTKDGDRVRAYRTGEKTTIEELNEYALEDGHKVTEFRYKSPNTLAEAKELYPEWYEKRIVQGTPKGHWVVKRDLYDWWKRQVSKSKYGHRYYFVMTLAIYAIKCGIDEDELIKDALELVPFLNNIDETHPFTKEDALKACEMYNADYQTFSRRVIEFKTDIRIDPNKRNYQKQADHLEEARALRDIRQRRAGTRWTDGNSRKGIPNKRHPKRELVRAWRAANPSGRKIDCHRDTGLSRVTIDKWWKS